MQEWGIRILLMVVAIGHLLPLAGVLGAEKLGTLYGVRLEDPSLEILMRHRAVLFGLLGAFLLYAVFQPGLRPLAFLAALVSILSFLCLAWSADHYNTALRKVVIGDVIAMAALAGAALLHYLKPG